MLAIIAVVTVIVLLIQDFIAFMSGDNSLIGSLFDKAGIGAENARQTILNAWTTVKEFLLTMWGVIKQAAQTIFGALSDWWEENGAAVMESFSRIWEGIKTLCETLWNALSSAAQTIFGALQRFWDTWGDTIISVFSTIWNTLIAPIQPFLDAIAAVIDFLANVFTGNWQGAWTAIKDFAASIWQMITTIITGALDIIASIWSTAVGIRPARSRRSRFSIAGPRGTHTRPTGTPTHSGRKSPPKYLRSSAYPFGATLRSGCRRSRRRCWSTKRGGRPLRTPPSRRLPNTTALMCRGDFYCKEVSLWQVSHSAPSRSAPSSS